MEWDAAAFKDHTREELVRYLLLVLADRERYRHVLERIVGWDYPCRDDNCGAGDVAARAFDAK